MPTQIGQSNTDAKELAFYSAVVSAWIDNRMERDKTVLSLSSAGIGLLATLLKKFGASSPSEFALYVLAALSFVASIIFAVVIFGRNSRYLVSVVQSHGTGHDRTLEILDYLLMTSFVVGVAFTIGLALYSGYSHLPIQGVSDD